MTKNFEESISAINDGIGINAVFARTFDMATILADMLGPIKYPCEWLCKH